MSLSLISGVIAALGALLAVISLIKLFKRKWLAGFSIGGAGVAVLAVAVVMILLASNLRTYQRLVYEMPVAKLSFNQIAPRRFNAELFNIRTGERTYYEIFGDEWQLDAQIITWQGLATVLGFDPQYRLKRISGRYIDVDQELSSRRSVHALLSEDPVDFWSFARNYQQWMSWVDVTYGSAVFLPMANQAAYSISISRTGLVVRPVNSAAQQAVGQWSNN